MFSSVQRKINDFLILFQKTTTLLLFFVLPQRVSKVFISLSILAMIYEVKKYTYKDHPVDQEKFNRLLNVSFNEDIMVLPSYTMHWFWKDNFLDTLIQLGEDKEITIREAIVKKDIFSKHKNAIIDLFISKAPKIIKLKLHLYQKENKKNIENNVVGLLGVA